MRVVMPRGRCGKVFQSFYQNKRVFVTGHTGFKGSWLVTWLDMLGAKVYGYALEPDTSPNHFSLLDMDISSTFGDIRDISTLEKALIASQAQIVFHLAAQPLVRKSYKNPIETYDVNVMGTAKLLEVCRKIPSIKSIVVVTTDKCYENLEWDYPYRETDRLGGFDPYSASKACTELVTNSYRQSFFREAGIHVATARAGNVIGGGDWSEDRLIPDIIKAIHNKQTVVIRHPKSIRPWQHVLESLNGYLILAQKLYEDKNLDSAWNFGPSDESNLTVEDILMLVKKQWSELHYEIQIENNGLHEATLLRLDASKARRKLGWESRWNAENAIKKTVEWYKSFYENKNILTKQQIGEFMMGYTHV